VQRRQPRRPKLGWADRALLAALLGVIPKARLHRIVTPGTATASSRRAFDDVFAGDGVRIIKAPVRSPRANSFAERYVGTLRRECLDHLLIYDERHLRRILAEYSRHYNEHRPHQSRELRPPLHEPGQTVDVTARIERRQVIHGLINEYRRTA
jgi:putative transposase